MKRNISLIIPLLTCLIFLSTACSRDTQRQKKIAVVNGAPVLLKDYKEEVALISRSNPSFKVTPKSLEGQLNTMIDRKLMIQEAVRQGLSDDKQFLKTIKRFWEQTLIRELIGAKSREWSDILFVTDDEVRSHYERMHYRLTVNVATAEREEKARALLEEMSKNGQKVGDDTIGPILLEDIQMTDPLYNAFTIAEGDTRIFQDKEGYTVIHVVKRENIQLPPLQEMYERIREEIFEQKKQRALEEWLQEIRSSSEITVNYSILQEVAREQ
ncbi:MAG: hypothetical protein ACE5GF_05500 [Thermodesulfobacteriota bacterium]